MATAFQWNPARWGLKESIIVMITPGVLVSVFILINYLGVKSYDGVGELVRERQEWNLKHSYQCYIDVNTKLGQVSELISSHCPHYWKPGDLVHVRVGVGRLTGGLIGGVVMKPNNY